MKRDVFNAVFEPQWQTFEGQRKKISEIDHQHLSNIHYWMNLTFPGYESEIVNLIQGELDKRFAGEILPYRPLRRFKMEMDILQEKGWLCPKPSGIGHNIMINNKWIGEVDDSLAVV